MRSRLRRGMVLLAGVLALASLSGCLNDFDEERLNLVWIRAIDVAAPVVGSGSVTLAVNVTIENSDADSGDLSLVVKAYNTATGLLQETVEQAAGTIERDRSEAVEVPVALPKEDGYRISVTLFQDDVRMDERSVQVSKVSALANTVATTDLQVEDIEFLVRNVTDSSVRIETQVYLTNTGPGPSEPLRLQVKAREVSTGLLADDAWANVSDVPSEATRIAEVSLQVPDAYNYIVEAVLWDGELRVAQGEGKVQLLPTFTVPKEEEVVVQKPEVENFVRDHEDGSGGMGFDGDGEDEATPGLGVLAVLAALAVAVLILGRRN